MFRCCKNSLVNDWIRDGIRIHYKIPDPHHVFFQVEAISMYSDMKTDLMEYLGNFARQGKVVKEEDIRNFFQVEFLFSGLGTGSSLTW